MGAANYDVVVVGAGAAGLAAAIGLAKANFSVCVVEAAPFPGAENWSGCVYFCESLASPELLGPDGVESLAWERRVVERGVFTCNAHAIAGATYRDPAAFRDCYTVLRPIFDHHLAQCARQAGAAILADTTAEGLIRERGRVIGVSTQRGPIYADLVFLAEGDASHLVTKEGYERETPGRQAPHFLQGVKQVIDMPEGAIERIFGLGAEEGAAYEILLRNARFRGRETNLNAGGFLYTNRRSISLGFVLPLENLHDSFAGDPHVLMEWLRGLPDVRRWTEGGTPGVFGAKLIRGGGSREIPHLADHGLAIGGAASGIGVDFPYPNFTGPATGMGLLVARAAVAIRQQGGSFTLDELKRHYVEPLRATHWWADVHHLRRWPGYVAKTRFFFSRNIDAMHASLYTWTRPDLSLARKWSQWARLVRATLPPASWRSFLGDSRRLAVALLFGTPHAPKKAASRNGRATERRNHDRHSVGQVLLGGAINSLRDLLGRARPRVEPVGELRWHYSVRGGREPAGVLPGAVAGWGRRLTPVLSEAAREIYRNDPTPLAARLSAVTRLLINQVNLLDVIAAGGLLVALLATIAIQTIGDWLWAMLRRGVKSPRTPTFVDEWIAAAHQAGDLAAASATLPVLRSADQQSTISHQQSSDSWEDKLGRLTYESTKDAHIKLHWPRDLARRGDVADAGLWNVCPAKVYECHKDAAGSVRLVVNHENCIKCESCWRASDLVDWARNGAHRFIYRVESPVSARLLESLDRAADFRPRPPKSYDWWATLLARVGQRAAASGGNGKYSGELGKIETLCDKIETKLREMDRRVSADPRTIDEARGRSLDTLATYAQQLTEDLVVTVRDGSLARSEKPGLRDVQAALAEAADSLQSKMAETVRRAYDRQFFWAVADGRQIISHHLEGMRRMVRLLRSQFAPGPLEEPPQQRWLRAEEAAENADPGKRLAESLDAAFDGLAWRDLDRGVGLNPAQIEALQSAIRLAPDVASDAPGRTSLTANRKAVLADLGRRDPSLGYTAATHLWARDLLRAFGGAATSDLLHRIGAATELAAYAHAGVVEIDRDDQGVRLRGQKIFVPSAAANWFVLRAGDQLIALPRTTPGLSVEPLGTLGMRGSSPATLVLDNVAMPATRATIDGAAFDRLWAVVSAADLAAIAAGMAERLEQRAIQHATSRVQFPGLFLDDESRESLGKFGAVKKMLAQIGARRYMIETLLHQIVPATLTDDVYRRALELKLVVGESFGGHPGSITYNVTQIYGGTGYSEEDVLPKLYRDGSCLTTLGVAGTDAAVALGEMALRGGPPTLAGLPDGSSLFSEAVQRKALQNELDMLLRTRHAVESAVARWKQAAQQDPQAQAIHHVVGEGVGRRQAELAATEAMLLRTHARLEAGLPAELETDLVRTWMRDAVNAASGWIDWLADSDCHAALPSIEPPAARSPLEASYAQLLDGPSPYQNGDFLVKPFDPGTPRYTPELAAADAKLANYDRELDAVCSEHFQQRSFAEGSYERHVEQQHRLDPEDFDLFRRHGFLRMYIPRSAGGMGKSKAEYNLLVKNLIKHGDVGMALTVQANSSIGTVPVLLALNKDLPRAQREFAEFRKQFVPYREVGPWFFAGTDPAGFLAAELISELPRAWLGVLQEAAAGAESTLKQYLGTSAAVRVVFHKALAALDRLKGAVDRCDADAAQRAWGELVHALDAVTRAEIDAFADELDRRVAALTQFQQWIGSGQMTAFALTEPGAGSDTARVATRAVLRSVVLQAETDGSYRFTPVAGGGERRMIDARRLEFRGDGAHYRWSETHEPAAIMFDEYDYEAADSDQPRYYMAGPVKVPFHDIGQVRSRDRRLVYDYWELNGAKMWLTNARLCGVMVLYARTEHGVTGFYVDRHAEGLLVGKNEEKMGQKASVTNELGLQAVRVPRENMVGLEGRGQVNALESLNAGRAGLTTSSTTSMDDLIARAAQFARLRHDPITPADRARLEEMAEIRYLCQSIAYELVGRADHRETQSLRIEPSIGKMMSSELLMRVIELGEEIYGLEGHTTLYNLEKHKRDQRIITVYEGANDVQRSLILKDLVRDIAGKMRHAATDVERRGRTAAAGSDKLQTERTLLEELKRELRERLGAAVAALGDELWQNPSVQSVSFQLADAAAWVKLADSALGRAEWALVHFHVSRDASYREWTVRIVRRSLQRLALKTRQLLASVSDDLAALRQGVYPPQVRAANLMMAAPAHEDSRPAAAAHQITRPVQIAVVVEPEPTLSPVPLLADGRWAETHYQLDAADAAAVATARTIADAATAATRVVVVGVGPRRAARALETALAAGADEAVLIVADNRPLAPEAMARAVVRAVESHCRAPDLVLCRRGEPGGAGGLVGMLVSRELGLPFVTDAAAFAVTLTDESARAAVWSGDAREPRGVPLPAGFALAAGEPARPCTGDWLAAADRSVKLVAWPEEITRRFVSLAGCQRAAAHSAVPAARAALTPDSAAHLLIDALGLGSAEGDDAAETAFMGFIQPIEQWPTPDQGVLLLVRAEPTGRLSPAERRIVRAAAGVAREWQSSLTAFVCAPAEEELHRLVAGELAKAGASRVFLGCTDQRVEPRRAAAFWSRVLLDRWSPELVRYRGIVAGEWAEPALCRFGARQAEVVLRVNELTTGPRGLTARNSCVAGKVDATRELPRPDPKPLWMSLADSVECDLPSLDAAEPDVSRWNIDIGKLPGRRELLELIASVRQEAGVARLSEADFIIDVGFGIGGADGFEQVVLPLEQLLRKIGVPNVTLAASRKVTDELRLLPPSQQIGQTGSAVNPTILLAIGISGAPQHLNYIGPRATILAFNRDPEAPLMTLNRRQPRPRVFPIVGDLFETVPAFAAALGETEVGSPPAAGELQVTISAR
jgi:electron transfer flavoprotein-quinone oxidoreductase